MHASPTPRHRGPSGAHNAQNLSFEATVTYPFHPFNGKSVSIVGEHWLADVRHLIMRKPNGGAYYIPAWMVSGRAGAIRILSQPRLPVDCLLELRLLVDRLICLSSREEALPGGPENEAMVDKSARSVRATTPKNRADAGTTDCPKKASGGAVKGGRARIPLQRRRGQQGGRP